jgi:hypothetical protein
MWLAQNVRSDEIRPWPLATTGDGEFERRAGRRHTGPACRVLRSQRELRVDLMAFI